MTAIQDLKPDFVLDVAPDKDQIVKLIELLHDNGFYTAIRENNSESLLVFLKASSFKLEELTQQDQIKNYEFGITAPNTSTGDKFRILHNNLVGTGKNGLNIKKFEGLKSITPITESLNDSTVYEDLTKHLLSFGNPSVEFIKDNFGIRVALYFEFLKFFIRWLILVSVFGLTSYWRSKHLFSLTYCIVNLVLSVVFLIGWKKRQSYLVSLWGNNNYHLIQEHDVELSDINDRFEEKSSYKHKGNDEGHKFLKQLVFVPVALGFAAILLSYQLTCFVIEIFLTEIYDGPGKSLLSLLPTVLLSVFVPVFSIVFGKVSDILVAFEGHNNSYTKNNSIVIKHFILNFLTSYVPLLITSFIYLPFAHLIQPSLPDLKEVLVNRSPSYFKYLTYIKNKEDFQFNQGRLAGQYNYFIVVNEVIQLFMKYGLPPVLGFALGFLKKKEAAPKDDEAEKSWLNSIRKAVSLPVYNPDDDLRFVTIVYGYLTLFGPVWSLAPLVTLGFMIITLKLDYLKLLNGKYFKPPIPERVDSIYPWNYAIFILTWLGSVVSPAITTFYHHNDVPAKSFGQFTLDKASINTSTIPLILILFLTEHGFLIVYFVFYQIAEYFKSEKEWENDFTDNDIKLRHDHYTSEIKGKQIFEIEDAEEWKNSSSDYSISHATAILSGSAKPEQPTKTKIISGEGLDEGSSSGYQEKVGSIESRANKTLEQTKTLAGNSEDDVLASVRDAGDSVIKVPSTEGAVSATIDDNHHIQDSDLAKPQHSPYQQDYEAASTSSKEKLSKSKSLKKLLRKNK